MNIYDYIDNILAESGKPLAEFNIDAGWHMCKDCLPSDDRPVFVAHKDSYNTPGRIAHYDPSEGWFRYLEGKTKKKMSTPRRWHEALVPETYKKFTETKAQEAELSKLDNKQ